MESLLEDLHINQYG